MDSQREYWIKNMVCSRCLKVIKQDLEEIGVEVLSLELGKLSVRITTEIDKKIELFYKKSTKTKRKYFIKTSSLFTKKKN